MSRPLKEPHERRSAKLPPIRFTEAELADLRLQADRAGLSVTELVRQRAMKGKAVTKPGLADAQLLSELNRIGVNLNQIARQVNRASGRDPHQLDYVLGLLVSILERVGRPR